MNDNYLQIVISKYEEAENLLAECAKQFRFYEASHQAKCTPEGYEKAAVNRAIAQKIEEFIRAGL